MPVPLTFTMVDNNGRAAEMRFWLRDTVTLENVDAWPAFLEAGLAAVSSAAIARAEVKFDFPVSLSPVAGPASDVKRYLLLFYRDDADAAAVQIVPSPGSLPLDLVGSYRAVRLGVESVQVSNLQAAMDKFAQGTLTPGGTPWPATFRVGGVTRGDAG